MVLELGLAVELKSSLLEEEPEVPMVPLALPGLQAHLVPLVLLVVQKHPVPLAPLVLWASLVSPKVWVPLVALEPSVLLVAPVLPVAPVHSAVLDLAQAHLLALVLLLAASVVVVERVVAEA